MVESASGLRFKNSTTENISNKDIAKSAVDNSNLDMLLNDAALSEKSLVNPEDRILVTDYIFIIMCQMVQFPFKNKENDRNELALCCKHCMGKNGKGIFNRTKVTSISKNEFFKQIHSHIENCSHCPDHLKEAIDQLKELHDIQKRKLKRGNRKEFFLRFLNRASFSN